MKSRDKWVRRVKKLWPDKEFLTWYDVEIPQQGTKVGMCSPFILMAQEFHVTYSEEPKFSYYLGRYNFEHKKWFCKERGPIEPTKMMLVPFPEEAEQPCSGLS